MLRSIHAIYTSNDWGELERKINKYREDGDQCFSEIFERLSLFCLQINPVYRCAYKEFLHRDEFMKRYDLKKKLGLHYYKKKEQGIDGILIAFDDKLVAVQCKYKENIYKNLTADDLNDTLRVVNGKEARKNVDMILICSNTKGITKNKNIRNEFIGQIKSYNLDKFKELKKRDFDQIRKLIDKKIPTYKPIEPMKHQKEARKKAKEYFKNNDRGKLIHACGSGKTLTSFLIYKDLKPKITLVILPGLQLLRQTLLDWTKESLAYKDKIQPILICSDKSNEDLDYEPLLWREDIGIKVSNEYNDFKKLISNTSKNILIFCTYQSSKTLIENCNRTNTKIDFAVFDEAHNTVTKRSKPFSFLLDNKNIFIKKRLFMTATPKNFIGKKDEVSSMNNSELYGNNIHELTVKEAIEEKILNDYEICTPKISKRKVNEIKKLYLDNSYKKTKLPEEVEFKLIATSILYEKIVNRKKINSTVSFHSRKSRAKHFSEIIRYFIKDLKTYYVNGKQTVTERNNILEEFTLNNPSLVSNAQCLSEGVNLPFIDSIIFVDPKQSRVSISQAIGRALRKPTGKKSKSCIIVPTIIDEDNPEKIEDSYQQIIMVLRALAEHDGRIIAYLKCLKEGKKPPKKFIEDDTEFLSEDFDIDAFNKELSIRSWDKIAKLGMRTFEDARQYIRSKGFNSISEFKTFMDSKLRPIDIPLNPDRTYQREWISWYDFLGTKTEQEKFDDFLFDFRYLADKRENKEIPYFPTTSNIIGPRGTNVSRIWGFLTREQGNDPLNKRKQIKDKLNDLCVLQNRDDWVKNEQIRLYSEWLENNNNQPYPPKGLRLRGFDMYEWFKVANAKMKNIRDKKKTGMQIRKDKKGEIEAKKLSKLGFPFHEKKRVIWDQKIIEMERILEEFKGIPTKYNPQTRDNTWVNKEGELLRFKDGTLMGHWFKKHITRKDYDWEVYPERKDPILRIRKKLQI